MRAITVAHVQGHCVGGGVVLAAACDLRVAGDSAGSRFPRVALGVPLTWGGIPRLVHELGPAMTKELVLTCRPFDAAEAKAVGFVNRVVPDDELDAEVDSLVAVLESRSAFTLEATKRHVATRSPSGWSGASTRGPTPTRSSPPAAIPSSPRPPPAAYLDGLERRG